MHNRASIHLDEGDQIEIKTEQRDDGTIYNVLRFLGSGDLVPSVVVFAPPAVMLRIVDAIVGNCDLFDALELVNEGDR